MFQRLLVNAIVFLVVGAAVNVVVAWASVIWIDPEAGPNSPAGVGGANQSTNMAWFARVWRRPTVIRVSYAERILCPDDAATVHTTAVLPWWSGRELKIPGRPAFFIQEARGWPLLSLWCEYEYSQKDSQCRSRLQLGGINTLVPAHYSGKWLALASAWPLRPILWGFAVNTVFYAAAWWIVIAGPGKAWGLVRLARGLCAACGYPIGASDVCTECGRRVKRRSVAKPVA